MNNISISSTSLPRLEGRNFYELSSIIKMMNRFLKEPRVDGFEFALLPEWDSENPPLTPSDAPRECEKHTVEEVLAIVQAENFPILSVHANRDVGNYLCSEDEEEVVKGIRLMRECLDFTRKIGSKICVFHFWDTWKEAFNLRGLQNLYQKFQRMYSEIETSIENIPTRYKNKTPFQIMQNFRYKTLDLKWASLFNEFNSFAKIIEQVDNIHIQGKCQHLNLVPSVGNLDYERAIRQIKDASYSGVFTIELEGRADYRAVLKYIKKLKRITA